MDLVFILVAILLLHFGHTLAAELVFGAFLCFTFATILRTVTTSTKVGIRLTLEFLRKDLNEIKEEQVLLRDELRRQRNG